MKVLKPVFILLSNFELEYLREFLSYNGEFYIIGFLRLWRIQWCNRFQIPITGCRNIVVFRSCSKSWFLTFFTKFFWWVDFDYEYLRQFLLYNGEINIFGFLRLWGVQWYKFFWGFDYQLARYWCFPFVVENFPFWRFYLPWNFCWTLNLNISASFCPMTGKIIFLDSLGHGESNSINFIKCLFAGYRNFGVFRLWLRNFSLLLLIPGICKEIFDGGAFYSSRE